jgi:aryl-alcohol dehydrogenase-like predicted oxidoreductase
MHHGLRICFGLINRISSLFTSPSHNLLCYLPMAKHEGMAICPYSPLNQGRFQTKEGFEKREKDNNQGRNFISTSALDKQVSAVLELLAHQRKDGTELLHFALAFVLQKTPYVFPIIGGREVEHLTSNIKALEVTLTTEEIEAIEDEYDFDHGFPTSLLNKHLFDPEIKSVMVTEPSQVKIMEGNGGDMEWVGPAAGIRPKA